MPTDLIYALLVFALFVAPKMVQRLRVPGAITSLAMGLVAGLGLGLFEGDPAIKLLGTFGIVSLFLFAGLEVDVEQLGRGAYVLGQHLVMRAGLLAIATALGVEVIGLAFRPRWCWPWRCSRPRRDSSWTRCPSLASMGRSSSG